MPIDFVGKRRTAAEQLQDKGFILELQQPVYSGEKKMGVTVTYAWALLDSANPSQDRDIANQDLVFTVAALQSDVTGKILDLVLVITMADFVVFEKRRYPVLRPNIVGPTGDPIIYDQLLAGIRKRAKSGG